MSDGPPAPATEPLSAMVEFRAIGKRFGAVDALSRVTFAGRGGTVHAITGENGAGKSTLMKLLAGVFPPDAGEILMDGRPVHMRGPSEARAAGVSTVFQELTLLPNLTVAENLFLGREPRKLGFVDRSAMRREARRLLDQVGVDLDVDAICGALTIAEQHLIEIAKGAAARSRIIIYDEPTAALDAVGVDKLVRLIEGQRRDGKLVFYISHRLDEIFRLSDMVTVLKDGQLVTTRPTAELTRDGLVSLMVGRELAQLYPRRGTRISPPRVAVSVSGFVTDAARPPVTFDVHRGEIVGLAGIEGQGQREIIRALSGLAPRAGGTARKLDISGSAVSLGSSVVATTRAGVGFIPEDRKQEGLCLPLSIQENIGLGLLRTSSMLAVAATDRPGVRRLMQEMNVRARSESQVVSSLSGGNQQKVMIGRWLASGVDVLLVEEPTRGVDVGAKSEIYRLLRAFADNGGAILMTSSELTEHLGLCDRILVVREGAIVADLAGQEATEEIVMTHALLGRAREELCA